MQESERIRLNSERMMLEQLQAMTAAMANLTTLRTMEAETSKKMDDENKIAEEVSLFEDDMAEYVASHRAKSRDDEEIQKLKEKVDTVTQKMKGKHEDLLDYDAMAFKEQLPQNFKMPEMAKFDGKGDPKTHIRQYVSLMSATGLSQNQVRKMFGMSLEGAPVVWYHNLEEKVKEDWRALAEAFLAHYVTDLDIDSSLRDLENVKQKPEESFKEYMDRWKIQLVRMQTRPSEKDQIKMIIKGTKPFIYNRMRRMTSMITDFKQLKEAVMDIEEEEAENKKFHSPWQNKKNGGSSGGEEAEVNAVQKRRFSNLPQPMSKIFERLMKRGLLKPLESKPLPSRIPHHYNLDHYYCFHQ